MAKREPNAKGDGDQLRAQLVAAASDLLLTTQSIALPSLRAVARACSVSPAAVYLHFDSQRALVNAVIQAQLHALREQITAAIAGVGPNEVGGAFAAAYVSWGLEHPGAYQLLFESRDLLGLHHDEHDEGWDLLEDAAKMLAQVEGVDEVEAHVLAVRIWSGLHGIVSLRLHKPDNPWPSSIEDDVRATLQSLQSARG